MTRSVSMSRTSHSSARSPVQSRMSRYRCGVEEPMPGRSMPMMRRSLLSANSLASTGIWRRAPGVPCIHTMAAPRGLPNSAKESRRPSRTATEPSSRGRSSSFMRRILARGRRDAQALCGIRTAAASTMFQGSRTAPSSTPSAETGRPVDHGGEQAGDVVAAAGGQRGVDQVLHRGVVGVPVRIRSMSRSRTRSVSPSLASSTRSPGTQVDLRDVARLGRVAVHAARDHVAPGVVGHVLLDQRALVDQPLHPGVVAGDPGQRRRRGRGSRASRPGAPARTARRRWRPRSAWWPCRPGVGSRATPRATCSWARRIAARSMLDGIARGIGQRGGRDDVRRGGRGDLAGRGTADAVGDEHAGGAQEPGVLVAAAHETHVAERDAGEPQHPDHPLSWSNAFRPSHGSRVGVPGSSGGRTRHNGRHGMAAARDLRGPGARLRGLRRGRVHLRGGRPRPPSRRRPPRETARRRACVRRCAASPPSSPAPRSASP